MSRTFPLKFLPLLLLLANVFIGSLYAQALYEVRRGERPPINLASTPADAWEPGIIKIKLTETAERAAGSIDAFNNADGIVQFGFETIDNLNLANNIQQFDATFSSAAFNSQFAERHRAWGFHRWFTLYVDDAADIPALVAAYQALEEVELAEPEFRKRLIGNAPDNQGNIPAGFDPAEPRARWTPNDPQLDQQWHYHNTGQQNGTPGADIELFEAWEIEKGNADVIVAIIDDGIQFTHPDLAGNMWDGIGFNFVNNSPNISPGNHGTHVAGTVAAVNNNAVGVAGVAGGSGSNDGVRLMSAQVFSGAGQGGFNVAPIWAADNGAAISQNSWGYTSPNVYDQAVLDAIDYFNTNGGGDALIGGGITIFAAGNDNGDAAYYPGFYSGAFTIAATNNQDVKSWYSNYGTWIDISAPGGETNTVTARGVLSTLTNNGYGFYQGTSMACPHASGVAALVVSQAFGELTPEELADILRNTTDDIYANNPGFIGKLGTGRLNALNALLEAQSYINGVRNPASFSAEALDQNHVMLSWVSNADNNPVLIAYAETPGFGTPEAGIAYAAGEEIPGGGIVLFAGGDLDTFEHEGLTSATMYYYRAWSFDDTLAYSVGRSTSAVTACDWYELPFLEGFEESTAIPFCWVQQSVTGGWSWSVGAGNGGNNPPAAYGGGSNIYHRSTGLFETGLTTRLISPQLNLENVESAELTFHFTNARRTFLIFNFQDVLRVLYKNAADAEWVLLETFNSNVTNWTEVTIDLPELSGDYYIAFEAVANSGWGVCLDEIEVNGDMVAGFYILAEAGDNGSINPAGQVFVPVGNDQNFEIASAWGYHIGSLMVDDAPVADAEGLESYTYLFGNVQQTHNISAAFDPNVYSIDIEVVPAGMGDAWYNGESYHGSEISLEAMPAVSAYEFSHWQVDGDTLSKENPYSLTLTGNMQLQAVFIVVIGQDELAAEAIQLYPNPGNGAFNLQLPAAANVQVFNRQGQVVYAYEATAGLSRLNLKSLGKGVYIIRLQGKDFVETRQLIIF